VKLAVVAPEATVTEDGVASRLLLSESVTTEPPEGAAELNVTVQVPDAPALRLVGLQTNVETVAEVCRLNATESALLPNVAVTVADRRLLIIPATTVKVAEVAPAATVTEDGVVSKRLLSASATIAPPAGAAWFSRTVQLLTSPESSDVGEQDRLLRTVETAPVMVPPAAVMLTLEPSADTATGVLTPMVAPVLAEARVTLTVATTPLAILLLLMPETRQV
jgi:hypothetical protein